MRHSRAHAFDLALKTSCASGPPPRWTDVASDPNDPAALAIRASVLRAAWRPPIDDRNRFLVERSRGKRVLDIGCVAHDPSRMDTPRWLHRDLAAVAKVCTGVDVLPAGVEAMRDRGFTVELHDLRDGLGPVGQHAPFDTIVAGELIEHVESLGMLFTTARDALTDGGELIVTTPNPYAPHRVRAAQRGVVWENVDHVMYATPSGMAELADRHGMVLSEAGVTDDRPHRGLRESGRWLKRRIRGRQWMTVGFATVGPPAVRRVESSALRNLFRRVTGHRRQFTGETFVYVFRLANAGLRQDVDGLTILEPGTSGSDR